MHQVYLGLGTNEGKRIENLRKAMLYLSRLLGTITTQSSIYETQPWGEVDQANFLNMVVLVETNHTPRNTLHTILAIETLIGRVRKEKWGSRLIDIDLLFYDELVIEEPSLVIPHPYIQERNFVLVPLNEIAANKMHPRLNRSIQSLMNSCKDPLVCEQTKVRLS